MTRAMATSLARFEMRSAEIQTLKTPAEAWQ